MRRPSADTWIAIALLLVLIAVTIAAGAQQTRDAKVPALSDKSNEPAGARALWLWLGKMGYTVLDQASTEFVIPEEAKVVMMLEPLSFPGISEQEWEQIDAWVSEGGTLFLAGEGFGMLLAAQHYKFSMRTLSEMVPTASPPAPILRAPALASPAAVQARAYFETERSDFLPLLTVEQGPMLVQFRQDAGQVILFANSRAFSNAGLKEEGNPELVLNLLALVDPQSVVWFDEWHHGNRLSSSAIEGPSNWLRYTPAGRALLYVAAVIFVGLVLAGRNFGRPVPLEEERSRRAPIEYVTAIANLNRRAGHRGAVLAHYKSELKRRLGKRYRLDPSLKDAEFVRQLTQYNSQLDGADLQQLLNRLSQPKVSENEMVRMAAKVAEWLYEEEQ